MNAQPNTLRSRFYQAAGGVVLRGNQVLLLRKSHPAEVRLPKGEIESGETPEQAALREVAEESGYAAEVLADLGSRTVSFEHEDVWVTREERYFLMRLAAPDPSPRGAKEEAKFEVVWVPASEGLAILTFESEREALRRALLAAG